MTPYRLPFLYRVTLSHVRSTLFAVDFLPLAPLHLLIGLKGLGRNAERALPDSDVVWHFSAISKISLTY
jgi:hypothetical protein